MDFTTRPEKIITLKKKEKKTIIDTFDRYELAR